MPGNSFDLQRLRKAYRAEGQRVSALVSEVMARTEAAGDDHVWINRVPGEALRARAQSLDRMAASDRGTLERLPLFGIPFAVKDNIDFAGMQTTAACPGFSYRPKKSAHCVERLLAAGAILIGKTNLDQFATGLVGTRSPYGVPRNPFDARYIPGGSSSGSAVAVASGLVSFALGTDTAGSGRVPAAFNNIVGLKPTRGLVSTRGVVPACASLDCVSIFALTVGDAEEVLGVVEGFDVEDPFSRRAPATTRSFNRPFRFALPRAEDLQFFGDSEAPTLFDAAARVLEAFGGTPVEIDFTPFRAAAELLYGGPWVAERLAAIEHLFQTTPEALLPITRQIVGGATRFSAVDAFKASYELAALRRQAEPLWDIADVLVLPTAGTIYTMAEIEADPIRLNTNLGYYTNFVNFFDLAALAVPAGYRRDGLPFGITLVAPAFSEAALARLGAALLRHLDLPLGATRHRQAPEIPGAKISAEGGRLELVVVGGHLSGMPLNRELVDRDGTLVSASRTAPVYRMFLLGGSPARPGLVRTAGSGRAFDVEIWSLDLAAFGSFVASVPSPLTIGTVLLEDGRGVKGFLCESSATADSQDISDFGGWRQFLGHRGG